MARLLTLQVVRGIAANLVVLQHLTEFEPRYAGAELPAIAHYGDLGVDVFFVLSGFVMVAIAGRNVSALQFLWRRAARIYPTYWLATLVILAVAVTVPGLVHEQLASIPLWRSFLLIAATPKQPVVSVGWTLVHEVYFYLVFAAILMFRIPILAGIAAWGGIIIIVTMLSPQYLVTSPVLEMATSPLTFEFMMGLVIGVLWLHGHTPRVLVTAGAAVPAALVAMLVLLIAVHYHFFAQQTFPFGNTPYLVEVRVLMFGIPIALILYSLVAYERHFPRRLPALLVALGDWSYSVYLFHFMVLSALGRAVFLLFPEHSGYASVTLFVVGFSVVNLAGAAVYVLFERPTLRWLHRLGPTIPKASGPADLVTTESVRVQ
ncbi:MAG: acyltransferase family protein [Xanthobacteraceae bacterium]